MDPVDPDRTMVLLLLASAPKHKAGCMRNKREGFIFLVSSYRSLYDTNSITLLRTLSNAGAEAIAMHLDGVRYDESGGVLNWRVGSRDGVPQRISYPRMAQYLGMESITPIINFCLHPASQPLVCRSCRLDTWWQRDGASGWPDWSGLSAESAEHCTGNG